jgi:hypothetical protein
VSAVPPDRDVSAFEQRAAHYDEGKLGVWHHQVSSDQQAGLRECARVLEPGGRFVLVDLFSPWLIPTLAGARRGKARTRARASKLLGEAGFTSLAWHDVVTMIKAVTATT